MGTTVAIPVFEPKVLMGQRVGVLQRCLVVRPRVLYHMVPGMRLSSVVIKHWLPIITFCPVNNLPDPLYVSIQFDDQFVELYAVRARIRELLSLKCMYMEEAAKAIAEEYPNATRITVQLWFNRHTVQLDL